MRAHLILLTYLKRKFSLHLWKFGFCFLSYFTNGQPM